MVMIYDEISLKQNNYYETMHRISKKTINNRETYTEIKIKILKYFFNIFTEYIDEIGKVFFFILGNFIRPDKIVIYTLFILSESKWIQ